jgi:gliding motility-associated lipoprotein GldH
MASCSVSNDFEDHRMLKGESWDIDEPVTFSFDITDTTQPYLFGLDFRYTERFPWQDIFLFLQTTFPDGSISQDTLHCFLFEPDGKPVGKGNRIKELDTRYSFLRFPMTGHYTMRFTQGMRSEQVKGMVSFGISLKKKPSQSKI